jgi:hypothetical protein
LVNDYAHRLCQCDIIHPNKDQILNLALHLINDGRATATGKALIDFGLPKPPILLDELKMETNHLIRDQLEDDILTFQERTRCVIPTFNADEDVTFDQIHTAYQASEHAVFFNDSLGGT